jgi:hypothetical protein
MPKMNKGIVILEKMQFEINEFVIGVATPSHNSANISDPTFKRFMNICVGSPNLTKYKTAELRDERYQLGKKMLLDSGYIIEEK